MSAPTTSRRGDRADDGAALAVHQPATGVADEDRQQHEDHRADELAENSLGIQPVGMNRA
jgi:hypothetical protein